MKQLDLNYGLTFADLYDDLSGYSAITSRYEEFLLFRDEDLYEQYIKYQAGENVFLHEAEKSEFLMQLALTLEDFIISLFRLKEVKKLFAFRANEEGEIQKCNKRLIRRKLLTTESEMPFSEAENILASIGIRWNGDIKEFERSFADYLLNRETEPRGLEAAAVYAKWAVKSERHKTGGLFNVADKFGSDILIDGLEAHEIEGGAKCYESSYTQSRHDFSFTNNIRGEGKAYYNIHYCIYCHNREKDTCSKGLKNIDESLKDFASNKKREGCPLKQKISEMNYLKSTGGDLAALAIAMADNPMIIATGHRICNDCSEACIYQSQTPVDVPMVETQIVEDILNLDWGFEIYSLLSKWNPIAKNFGLDLKGRTILVAGLGPAGFTLSHHMLNRGAAVVAIDSMKIEFMPEEISGRRGGEEYEFKPIFSVQELYDALPDFDGFGGVMRYGITSRWDKRYLSVVRTILERRNKFRMFGCVRFGSALDIYDAQRVGFDHVSLAIGAGKPKIPKEIINMLSRGVRTASDFLMSLHLSDASSIDGFAGLQLRLPVVVIGGGLTAVDAATESLTYYCIQVERFLRRCEIIGFGFIDEMSEELQEIAYEFIEHAKLLRKHPERQRELLKRWGGASIIYRGKMKDSAAYKVNREELELSMRQGVSFIEDVSVKEVVQDKYGGCQDILFCGKSGGLKRLKAKSVMIATGTNASGQYDTNKLKNNKSRFLVDDYISMFGDMNPNYFGSVVRAMASAKDGVEEISRAILKRGKNPPEKERDIFKVMASDYTARLKGIKKVSDNQFTIRVQSKAAAEKFRAGNFFRFQNYSSISSVNKYIEAIPLAGNINSEGDIEFCLFDVGYSSHLASKLHSGEAIAVSGPLGSAIGEGSQEGLDLLIGDLSTVRAVLSILKERKKQYEMLGRRPKAIKIIILYGDKYRSDDIEAILANMLDEDDLAIVLESIDSLKEAKSKIMGLKSTSVKLCFADNLQEYLLSNSNNRAAHTGLSNKKYHSLMDIKSARNALFMLENSKAKELSVAFADESLASVFSNECRVSIWVNASMQCMSKGICGQCLQVVKPSDVRRSPEESSICKSDTGYTYICEKQEVPLDSFDFNTAEARSRQNELLEIQSNIFIRLFDKA